MKHLLRRWRLSAGILAAAVLCTSFIAPQAALAGTTGNITGTVTDSSGHPVADVRVSAASMSQSATSTTDAHGFYSLVNLTADTYTVSFQKQGFQSVSVPGITVMQDQTNTVNQRLETQLKVIASVHAAGSSNLVKPNEGSNVYSVSGQELKAATNPVDTHETLYQFLAVTPGVSANGFPAQPRIRGGQVTDLGYEFEGIPIQDRIVGFFTSNLANIGLNNVEVYTGGLAGAGAINGTGYFNSVLKTGTYPAYTQVSIQASSPEMNNYLTIEHGWATPDHRFSGYIGLDAVNSQNQYDYGEHSYPNVLFWDFNGPGPVKTRDWVSNFHYRPNPKDDFQLVATNSLGEFMFNYLAVKSPGEPPILGFQPCNGAAADPNTMTGASGGTAPNGQSCPEGLYFGQLSNGTGGNIYHHYGGLGKIQWNHNINDHSFFNLRVAENFNQYIFDQPMAELNSPKYENPGGGWNWSNDGIGFTPPPGQTSGCPLYPYANGSPVQAPQFVDSNGNVQTDLGDICAFDDGINNFYGDRRSNIWLGGVDYVNTVNDKFTLKSGLSHEYDNNVFQYYVTNSFTTLPSGKMTWPGVYELASYPTIQDIAYVEGDVRVGKFLLDPGLTYAQRHYAYPADQGYVGQVVNGKTVTAADITTGGMTQRVLNPTFNGTFTFSPKDVVRFSYGDTTSFIASAYVYTSSLGKYASLRRDPFGPGASFEPQLNHSADLMWEHDFGNNTTMRVGPYYNKTDNYYTSYRPFLGFFSTPCDANNTSTCTPCPQGTTNCQPYFAKNSVLSNNNEHHTMGLEFGLNHINNAVRGTSYWISATYDNFWTSAADISGAYINTPLPDNITKAGQLIRSASNPLWSATALADYHSDRFHLSPLLYYQGDTFFNTGRTSTNATTGLKYISQNEMIAHGWFRLNLTAYEELGPKRNVILGLKADNLLDQVTDTAPCQSDGTGCFPFDGPDSGITNTTGYIYQNYSQSPRTFYFFAGVRL